jgi:serine/threonine protein phosphatase 1
LDWQIKYERPRVPCFGHSWKRDVKDLTQAASTKKGDPMATYVLSDIHGEYARFCTMLDLIHFSKDDTLYILGDVMDRGPKPVACMKKMMEYENIIPILGNHDVMAKECLPFLLNKERTIFFENLSKEEYNALQIWLNNGCLITLEQIAKLTYKEALKILAYLHRFLPYKELMIQNTNYVLVHAGLGYFEKDKPLSSYSIHDLVWTRTDYSKPYYEDKIVITGHTPTLLIDHAACGKIYQANNHIAIDCGACFGIALGCVCLESLECWYC